MQETVFEVTCAVLWALLGVYLFRKYGNKPQEQHHA
jgi:hypothetical protein